MSGNFPKLASISAPVEDRARVFFVDAPSKNLICLLCQEVFDDPVISECGHTFCRQCITHHNPSLCPVHQDRKLSIVVDNLAVREQVGDLNVRCQYGVRWTSDPMDETIDKSPTASDVNQNSNKVIGVLAEDGCPAIFKFNEKIIHEQSCEYQLVQCTNNAECPPVRKRDLESHLSQCRRAQCQFHAYGCTFSGNDGQLALHESSECRFEPMKEYFREVHEKLQDQNDQIKEKDQEITFLRSMVSDLSQRVETLEQKLETVQENTARTELDVVDLRRDLDAVAEGGIARRGSLIVGDTAPGDGELRCIGTFVGHEGPVWCLAEAGGCLFSGSTDTTIKVWDIMETFQCMKTLPGHKDIVLSLHAVNRKLFSGSSDLCFNVYNTETYSLMRRIRAHDNAVCTIVSAGDRLFTGSLMKIKVWDMATFALIKELTGTSWFRALAVNEGWLFSGTKEAIMIWDLKTYDCVRTLEFTGGSVFSIALFGGRYLLGGTHDNSIRVWDLISYDEMPELQGHTGAVYALTAFRQRGLPDAFDEGLREREEDDIKAVVISGAYDRSLRVWTLDEHGRFTCIQTLSRHSGSVSCLLAHGGRVYSGAIDSTIKVWCYR